MESDQTQSPVTTNDMPVVETATPAETEKVHDPVEDAAASFSRMLPSFKNMVNLTPSKKSLARVINALIEFPLGATAPRLLNDNERALFYLFQEISAHKGVVVNNLMLKMQEERKTASGNAEN